MKKYFIVTMILMAAYTFMQCSEDTPSQKEEQKELTLSVSQDGKSDIPADAITQIKIMSGNGEYSIDVSDPTKADVRLSDDGTSLLVSAKETGTTQVTVTDKKTGKKRTFTLNVYKKTVSVTGITLSPASKELKTGETFVVKAVITPTDADNKKVTWKSSNDATVSVDANGKVSALKEGTAIITATTDDGSKTATCTVAVARNIKTVTGITLNPIAKGLKVGESFVVTAVITPTDADNKKVTWTSSDNNIATVDDKGKVTARKEGTAVITATTADGGKQAVCAVAVATNATPPTPPTPPAPPPTPTPTPPTPPPPTPTPTPPPTPTPTPTPSNVPLKNVSIIPTAIPGYMKPGQTYQLKPKFDPENATNKTVTWRSLNPEIASVDPNTGLVTAIKNGETRIAVISAEIGESKNTCHVYVSGSPIPNPPTPPTPPTPPNPPTPPTPTVVHVTGVTVSPTEYTVHQTIGPNHTKQLKATVLPANATNKKVTWKSSNEKVVKVNSNGLLTFVKLNTQDPYLQNYITAGEAIITVTTVDGHHTATCKVTVTQKIN